MKNKEAKTTTFENTNGGKVRNFFLKLFHGHFRGLGTLVLMQYKNKKGVSFKADKKGALTKLLLSFIGFVVLTAAVFIAIKFAPMLSVFGTVSYVPIPFFNLIIFLMLTISTISCIGGLTNSLYFAKDNLVLLSFPVKPGNVFLSKLLVFVIDEIVKNVAFVLPLLIAYGVIYSFPWFYFIWIFFGLLVMSILPVAIASVVSIPFMFLKMFFRKRPLLQNIVFILALTGITVLAFYLIALIPAKLHFVTRWSSVYLPAIMKFCSALEKILLPFYWVSSLIIGCKPGQENPRNIVFGNSYSAMSFGIVVGGIALLITLAYLVARPLFLKIAAKPFEFNKRVIFHNFRTTRNKFKLQFHEDAFVPVDLDANALKKNKYLLNSLKRDFEKALNEINKERKADLFKNGQISNRRILSILKKYTGKQFAVVSLDELTNNYRIGFAVEYRQGMPFLVLVRDISVNYVDCYDPNYLANKNFARSAFLSALHKDLLVDTRTPGILVGNFILFVITPLAIALLNKIFAAVDTSFMGDGYTMTFNVAIMLIIILASNVTMASIYSREGESSYLLKASPTNYLKVLTTKLMLRFALMIGSIIFTVVVYQIYSDVKFLDPWSLVFAIIFIYTGHLLWCAELDYMNPQDRIYATSGEGTSINNPNENLATILVFVIAALAGFIVYFFFEESVMKIYSKLLLVSIIFFVCRVVLFVLKIKGYGTVRGERGRE